MYPEAILGMPSSAQVGILIVCGRRGGLPSSWAGVSLVLVAKVACLATVTQYSSGNANKLVIPASISRTILDTASSSRATLATGASTGVGTDPGTDAIMATTSITGGMGGGTVWTKGWGLVAILFSEASAAAARGWTTGGANRAAQVLTLAGSGPKAGLADVKGFDPLPKLEAWAASPCIAGSGRATPFGGGQPLGWEAFCGGPVGGHSPWGESAGPIQAVRLCMVLNSAFFR